MIWFSCKQCGKTHGRPETAAGATIFCDCGTGLVVPWESTAAEPAAVPAELAPPPLEPVPFEAPAVPVNIGRDVTLDIALQLAALSETVTVAAAPVAVSTRSSSLGEVITIVGMKGW